MGWDAGCTPEQVVEDLRAFGFGLFVGEDGAVHGKFAEPGRHVTLEMRAVIDRLHAMNDQVADLLNRETTYIGISVERVINEIGPGLKSGELELVGKLVYHRRANACDMTVRRRTGT